MVNKSSSLYFKPIQFKFKTPPEVLGIKNNYKVVIVGAGPVGLTAALELKKYNIDSIILSKGNTINRGSRAICISRQSMEIFQKIGVSKKIKKIGLGWTKGKSFYKGKTLTVMIGYGAGGGYDMYSRTLARFISKHIPGNPKVVGKNMPGAGSLKLANWMYSVAPKNGTVFATIARGAPVHSLLGGKGARFDATKFNWLGSMNNEVSVCATTFRAPAKTFADLQKNETIIGKIKSKPSTKPVIITSVIIPKHTKNSVIK